MDTFFDNKEVRERVRAMIPELEPKEVKVELFRCENCSEIRTMGELTRDGKAKCPKCEKHKLVLAGNLTEDDIIDILLRPRKGEDVSWQELVKLNHADIIHGWDQKLHTVFDRTGNAND